MNQPGMRVFPRIEGASARVRERLAAIPTAILSDNMSRAYGTSRLIAVHGKKASGGNAVTIKTRPGDNWMKLPE
jgi:regulator of RNase E activity RraA